MSWQCHCGLVNSGLNEQCAAANSRNGSHYQVSENEPDFLMAVIATKGLNMTPQEELFSKFYNQEKILVKDMDVVQLREHREELSQIAFEAKARLVATDDEGRERQAKTKNKEWLVTTKDDQTSSDAINAVKVRASRMSKMDRLRSQLLAAGIDEEIVKEMVGNLERKATESNVKAITFNKPSVEQAVVVVRAKKEENGEQKEFNPGSLAFAK